MIKTYALLSLSSLLAPLFLGCASSPPGEIKSCLPTESDASFSPYCSGNEINVLLSEDFDLGQRKDLATAFQDWSEKTHYVVLFRLQYVPNEKLRYNLIGNTDTFYFFHERPASGFAGWTEWNPAGLGAVIEVGDISNPNQPFLGVIKHEIGHALHLPHYLGAEPSVMEAVSTLQFIEPVDVQAFCAVWKIADCQTQ